MQLKRYVATGRGFICQLHVEYERKTPVLIDAGHSKNACGMKVDHGSAGSTMSNIYRVRDQQPVGTKMSPQVWRRSSPEKQLHEMWPLISPGTIAINWKPLLGPCPLCSVAFCSPATSLTFSGSIRKTHWLAKSESPKIPWQNAPGPQSFAGPAGSFVRSFISMQPTSAEARRRCAVLKHECSVVAG